MSLKKHVLMACLGGLLLSACGGEGGVEEVILPTLIAPASETPTLTATPAPSQTPVALIPSPTSSPSGPRPTFTPSLTQTPTPSKSATSTSPPIATLAPSLTPSPSLLLFDATPSPEGGNPVLTPSGSAIGRLEIGQTQNAEILQAGETQRYTFFGNSGDKVSIVANLDPADPASTLNPYLELQAPSGDLVASNDDYWRGARDALIRDYTLPFTGVYTVYVKSADALGTGKYLISLSRGFTLRDVLRGQALPDQANPQRLETLGAREVWFISLEAGDRLTVIVETVDRASGFDPMLEVVDEGGNSLGFDDSSGEGNDAFLADIPISQTGTYLIYVAARNNASVGDYRLWWARTR